LGAVTFGLAAALAWGVHDILIRYVSQKLGILVSLFAVLVFGGIAQSLMVLSFGAPTQVSNQGLWLSLAAGVTFTIASIGHYNAFQRGPVKLVAPIIGCYPVLAFAMAAATGAEISPLHWAALVALIIGIGLVARSSEEPSEEVAYSTGKTLAYCVMAMVGFAVTFELGQRASAIDDPLTSGLVTRIVTTGLVGIMLIHHIRTSDPKVSFFPKNSLWVLALMGMLDAAALGMVLASGIFDRPEFASAASSVFGLVTVILAWIFLREKINKAQWLGIVSVFAAIAYLAAS